MMNEVNISKEYRIAATEVLSILDYLPKSEVRKLAMIYRNYICSEEEKLEYDKLLCKNVNKK